MCVPCSSGSVWTSRRFSTKCFWHPSELQIQSWVNRSIHLSPQICCWSLKGRCKTYCRWVGGKVATGKQSKPRHFYHWRLSVFWIQTMRIFTQLHLVDLEHPSFKRVVSCLFSRSGSSASLLSGSTLLEHIKLFPLPLPFIHHHWCSLRSCVPETAPVSSHSASFLLCSAHEGLLTG